MQAKLSVLLCLLTWQGLASQAQDPASLRLITYNIRFDNPDDGPHAWAMRLPRVAQLLARENADIIGVQEALYHQLQDLVRELPGYTWVGVGRDDGHQKGEYCAILFRTSRLMVTHVETHWLSETPAIPGSKSWDAAITRIATEAHFTDPGTGQNFVILNTHFDHVGPVARAQSAALLLQKVQLLQQRALPVVLMGDFNSPITETAYQTLSQQLKDARPPGILQGTYCGFRVGAMPCTPIDHIFVTPEWSTSDYAVITENNGTSYPSDHLPVGVTVRRK